MIQQFKIFYNDLLQQIAQDIDVTDLQLKAGMIDDIAKPKMSKRCYCKSELQAYKNPPDFTCGSCGQEVSNASQNFWDPNTDGLCVYKQITQRGYIICASCYYSSNSTLYDQSTDKITFIFDKCRDSLNAIS